jgi:hypothetical protein
VGKTTLARLFLDNPRSPTNPDSAVLRDAIDAHPSDVSVHRGVATDWLAGILRRVRRAPERARVVAAVMTRPGDQEGSPGLRVL